MSAKLFDNRNNRTEFLDGEYPVTSDAIGNITSYNGFTYSYLGRQLTGLYNNESGILYGYNADGQRISKSYDSIGGFALDYDYYYNGSTLAGFRLYITEGVDTQEYLVSFMYDENGEPFGFTVNGDSYYYVRNAQNDIFLIVDSDNQGVVLYQYDAWGNITSCYDTTGGLISLINPYTYRGYYYDIETGYYYLNSRYYSPQLHRFISADNEYVSTATPMAMTDKNLFAYCDNNPVVRADDGGQFWNIIVGAAVGGALEIVGQLISGKSVKELNWAKIGVSALSGGLTAAVGPLAGCLISGATDVAMDALDGNINSLGDAAKSFAWGTAKAAISYGVGTAIGKATKSLSKIDKVGKLGKESYPGVKYSYNKGSGRAIRSIELHPRHNGHGIHLQGNKWNPVTNTRTSTFFRKTFWR